MKSRLFSKKLWLASDKFKNDLSKLLGFFDDTDIYAKLPNVIADVRLADTDFNAEEIYSDSAKRLNVDESLLRASFQLVSSFLTAFTPDGDAWTDSVESIVSDIEESKIVDSTTLDKLKILLESTKKAAVEKFYITQKKKEYESTGMPTLAGISSTVNLRAIFDNHYKLDKSTAEYSPKCEALTPVAIMKLRLDSDDSPDNVFFQMTPSSVRIMIAQLEALEKQMKEAVNFIKLNSK